MRPTIYIVVFKQLNKTGGIGEMLGFTDTAAGPASGFGPRAPVVDSLRLVRIRSCTNSLCSYIGIRITLSPAAEHVSRLAKLLTPQLSLGHLGYLGRFFPREAPAGISTPHGDGENRDHDRRDGTRPYLQGRFVRGFGIRATEGTRSPRVCGPVILRACFQVNWAGYERSRLHVCDLSVQDGHVRVTSSETTLSHRIPTGPGVIAFSSTVLVPV